MSAQVVGRIDEIPEGSSKVVSINGREFGIFNVLGRFVAIRNLCPHMGAPVCKGIVTGTAAPSQPGEYRWMRHGEILRCPWHGWEFDLLTGRSLLDDRVRVTMCPLRIHGDEILVCDPGSVRP